MKEQLEAIRQEAEAALQTCTDAKQLDAIRVQYLGKKGKTLRRRTSGYGTAGKRRSLGH